jgi:hypothetical protein
MLLCVVCGKIIANVDPINIRYGGCSACSLDEVKRGMDELSKKEK